MIAFNIQQSSVRSPSATGVPRVTPRNLFGALLTYLRSLQTHLRFPQAGSRA